VQHRHISMSKPLTATATPHMLPSYESERNRPVPQPLTPWTHCHQMLHQYVRPKQISQRRCRYHTSYGSSNSTNKSSSAGHAAGPPALPAIVQEQIDGNLAIHANVSALQAMQGLQQYQQDVLSHQVDLSAASSDSELDSPCPAIMAPLKHLPDPSLQQQPVRQPDPSHPTASSSSSSIARRPRCCHRGRQGTDSAFCCRLAIAAVISACS